MEKARDGKKYMREIVTDVRNLRDRGVTLIVCLLSDIEIKSIGTDVKAYAPISLKCGIEFFQYPIVEMAPPSDMVKWNCEVVSKVINHIVQNKGHVLIHCRGGVGRAGLLACNVLSALCQFKNHKDVIEFVRRKRDRRCVES